MRFYNTLSHWVIIFITAIAIYVVFDLNYWNNDDRVITWDVISYYGYLPATFIYKDVTLEFIDNNPGDGNYLFWFGNSPTGGKYIKMSMGLAVMYAPFFLLGHLGAHLFGYHTGGFSEPYRVALVFSCVFYLWLGLFFLRKALKQYFSEPIIVFVLILIVFGTNYFHYSTYDAPLSHTYNFALIAIFIVLTKKWYGNTSVKNSIFIGLLSGLISLIRPSNIIIVLLFIFYYVSSLEGIRKRMTLYKSRIIQLAIIVFFAFIVWIPQMIYWKAVAGTYLFYSYLDEGFIFSNPQIIRGLFSYRNGWLVYSPVMLFALLGIPLLYRYAKGFFIPAIIYIMVNIYVVLSWWCWWYVGFGNRAMIDSYAVLAFPLAAFIKWSSKQKNKILRYFIFTLIVVAFIQGAFHSIQYHNNSIHYGSMTKEAYWESFWKVNPTQEYLKKLREPDNAKAKKGIQAFLDERNDSLLLNYNLEKIYHNGNNFTDSTGKFNVFSIDSLSNQFSYSGGKSIYVNNTNPYGLGFELLVFTNQRFRISVWRKKAGVISHLVVKSLQHSNYYHSEKIAILSDGEWEKLQIEIEVPPSLNNSKLRIYVMNKNAENVYFDDLKIERIYKCF